MEIKFVNSEGLDLKKKVAKECPKIPVLYAEALVYSTLSQFNPDDKDCIVVAKSISEALRTTNKISNYCVDLKNLTSALSAVCDYLVEDVDFTQAVLKCFDKIRKSFDLEDLVFVYVIKQYSIVKKENKRNENKN